MKRVAFIIPYPLCEAPSQRFRFEQYFQVLQKNGYTLKTQSFLRTKSLKVFYSNGNTFRKLSILVSGLFERLMTLFTVFNCEFVFIHREASPIGPPVFEWIIAKILRKKIIYDFDDAIWVTDRTNESWVENTIRWRGKVASICKWSYKVSCGNEYLAMYAKQFNANVVINPTTIDTELVHDPLLDNGIPRSARNDGKIVIGWTGSRSTLKYLQLLESVMKSLEGTYSHVSFLVIADMAPELKLRQLKFISWNPETEIKDLLNIDIGIMPLPDDEWSRGKCGFKALQYMSLEIPAIVSPVGVNTELISEGVEGFLCNSDQEWYAALEILILDAGLRKSLGINGRKKVIEHYSVISNSSNFLSLFE